MALNNQEAIDGLKIRAIPKSAGVQINGKHFGMRSEFLQKKDKDGKLVVTKEGNPVYEQKLNGKGEPIWDANDNPVFVTRQVADEMYVNNEMFVWAIANNKAVSACNYGLKLDASKRFIMIEEKKGN